MTAISTDRAPAALGPYSQAFREGDLLFISGQLPLDAATGAIVSDDVAAQARQCMQNIAEIASAAGSDIRNSVKMTIILTDMAAFSTVNEVYATFLSAPYPARAAFAASALPKGAKVEIDAIVAIR
jgi:2-iminobutanoate/2-iminopropanoate deaminase